MGNGTKLRDHGHKNGTGGEDTRPPRKGFACVTGIEWPKRLVDRLVTRGLSKRRRQSLLTGHYSDVNVHSAVIPNFRGFTLHFAFNRSSASRADGGSV